MSHQAHHHLALQRGLQPDVKAGVKKGQLAGQLAESHLIFLQSNWNAAGHAAGQRGKQKKAAQAAGQAHFGDGADCDTCATKCTAIFNDEIKDCLIRESCQPWQKEDGAAVGHCQKRCDRSANWIREPCIRACQCDVDLIGRDAKVTQKVDKKADWAEGHHRCRSVPLGAISTCTSIAEHDNNPQFDSIKKCAKAAVQSGANTFNYYRTSKEWAKCSLRQCTSGDLQAGPAAPMAEAPAGHGTWKVFSTFCDAPAADQRSDTGDDDVISLIC